jgi:hypothetical protein
MAGRFTTTPADVTANRLPGYGEPPAAPLYTSFYIEVVLVITRAS